MGDEKGKRGLPKTESGYGSITISLPKGIIERLHNERRFEGMTISMSALVLRYLEKQMGIRREWRGVQ